MLLFCYAGPRLESCKINGDLTLHFIFVHSNFNGIYAVLSIPERRGYVGHWIRNFAPRGERIIVLTFTDRKFEVPTQARDGREGGKGGGGGFTLTGALLETEGIHSRYFHILTLHWFLFTPRY